MSQRNIVVPWLCFVWAVCVPLCESKPSPPLSAMSNLTRPNSSLPAMSTLRVTKRPFYNIAHMVNSVKEIDHFLAKGANAIETDIYFAPNATPIYAFHGYPCDCFRHCGERERLETFFDRIRQISTPNSESYNPKLVLVFLDLRLVRVEHSGKALAGQNMAQLLLKHVYNRTDPNPVRSRDGSNMNMVISIGHVFDYDFILGFQNEFENAGKGWLFRDYIGWDVGLNDPMFAIDTLWKRLDTIFNIWQGDGRSNCMTPFYNLGRLSMIIKRRDQHSPFGPRNFIRKAYQWTIDLTVNIRTALRSKVDGIITNHPERLLNVIREREFVDSFRLATKDDSPWQKVLVKASKPSSQAAAIVTPTLGLKWVNGAGDMLDSFAKYLAELVRYQTPIFFFGRFREEPQRRRAQISVQNNDPEVSDFETISATLSGTDFGAKQNSITSTTKARPKPLPGYLIFRNSTALQSPSKNLAKGKTKTSATTTTTTSTTTTTTTTILSASLPTVKPTAIISLPSKSGVILQILNNALRIFF